MNFQIFLVQNHYLRLFNFVQDFPVWLSTRGETALVPENRCNHLMYIKAGIYHLLFLGSSLICSKFTFAILPSSSAV